MGSVYQLPDLARMRACSERVRASGDLEVAAERVRASGDLEVAAFLATDEGRWFFTECCRRMPDDVARRLATVIVNGLPQGTADDLLRVFVHEASDAL